MGTFQVYGISTFLIQVAIVDDVSMTEMSALKIDSVQANSVGLEIINCTMPTEMCTPRIDRLMAHFVEISGMKFAFEAEMRRHCINGIATNRLMSKIVKLFSKAELLCLVENQLATNCHD